MKTKILINLRTLLIICLVTYICYVFILPSIRASFNFVSDEEWKIKKAKYAKAYEAIFNQNKNKFHLIRRAISKNKHGIFLYTLNANYYVLCTKFNVKNGQKVDSSDINIVKTNQVESSSGVMYQGFKEGNLGINYSSQSDSIFDKINLIHNGNYLGCMKLSTQIIRYKLFCTDLTIDYNDDNEVDFVLRNEDSNLFDKVPELLNYDDILMNKENDIYLLIVIPFHRNKIIQDSIYVNLFNDRL